VVVVVIAVAVAGSVVCWGAEVVLCLGWGLTSCAF
jgi:hypothetical protein